MAQATMHKRRRKFEKLLRSTKEAHAKINVTKEELGKLSKQGDLAQRREELETLAARTIAAQKLDNATSSSASSLEVAKEEKAKAPSSRGGTRSSEAPLRTLTRRPSGG